MGLRPPLVCLHPLGSDGSFWDPVTAALGHDVEVLAPDLLGHGAASPLPRGAGLAVFADQVAADLEERGITDYDLAGVSLGGLVAQELAGREPGAVRRLVLVDTVATYPEPMRRMWRDRALAARTAGLAPLADAVAAMWFTDAFRERGAATVARTRQVFLQMSAEAYARSCEALEGADTTQAVAHISAPTLVVCGSEDAPAFRDAAAWLTRHIEASELVWLVGGKHAAILERPGDFAAAVRQHIT